MSKIYKLHTAKVKAAELLACAERSEPPLGGERK